jgi:hypothetical protein
MNFLQLKRYVTFNYKMFSNMTLIIFGVVLVTLAVVVWKWWKTPVVPKPVEVKESVSSEPPNSLEQPPPMVFVVNDNGNLDLTDMTGKILNSSFGPHPKTYILLLDNAEKDTEKQENDSGAQFVSKVGTTKRYEVVGRSYILNFTRLQ